MVFQPHFTALGTLQGMPSDDHVAYYEERARGGVGLIIMESMAVHPTGKMSRRFINAWSPAVIPGLAATATAVHRHGTKLFGQITHAGHTSLENPPQLMWAPTQMPEPSSHHSTKAMDEDDIRAVIEGFAVSAKNLIEAGLDGIEVKIAHDGLLRSFASPFFNRRTDAFGGSFERRMRLSYEVLAAIKQAVGAAVPVGVRICVNEFTAFGYDTAYGLRMAAGLEATGHVDYFNSDAGSFSSYWMEIPPAAVPASLFRHINADLKHATKLPVIGFGRLTPDSGEALLAAAEADLVGMARQLIADPETVNKLAAGRGDLVRLCVACNDGCIHQVGQEKGVRCIHNPGAGQERTMSERLIAPAPTSRRVVVVGGGPAGLKVAEVVARRGHRVTLIERTGGLGGQLRLAARQPEHSAVLGVTGYLEAAIAEMQVEVRLSTEATVETIAALSPDAVVVATGSEPNLPRLATDAVHLSARLGRQVYPEIDGLDRPCVVSGDEVLDGGARLSGHVVVIDENGHWEAAGTAEYLADQGCRVTVITSHMLVGENLEAGTRTLFHRRAAIKGIALRPATRLMAIGGRSVRVAAVFSDTGTLGSSQYVLMPGASEVIDDVDWVVPVIGRRSREDLYLELKGHPGFRDVQVDRVGDCAAPRLIQSTIMEAFELARGL